jgi:peptide/nickel transport system permease protein
MSAEASLTASSLGLDAGEVYGEGYRWLGLREFARNRQARIGVGILLFMIAFCFLGPLIYRTNQTATNLMLKDQAPSGQHLLGTDDYGFDMIGALMRGGQASLGLGLAVGAISTIIGTLYGAISGMCGGIVDAIMMRVIDTLLAIPGLVLLLILVNMFTPSLTSIIVILSLLGWVGIVRLMRGEVLALRTRDFVLAAKTMGSGRLRMMWRHLVPNSLGIIIVNATFGIADSIAALATLSFLGLGMPPPYADWGTLLNTGLGELSDGYWWLLYPPAVLLIVTIIGFSLIGDAVRDSLDVRLRRR